MPSPIAHVAAGYAVYHVARRSSDRPHGAGTDLVLLGSAVGLSLLPDLDSAVGILMGDFGRYHNNLSHSLFVAVAIAAAVGWISTLAGRREGVHLWFGLALAAYGLHVIMDYFTWGRGVMLLWPVTSDRFTSPLTLFYGLHWSEGFVSRRHLWTFLSETPVAAAAVFTVRRLAPARSRSGG